MVSKKAIILTNQATNHWGLLDSPCISVSSKTKTVTKVMVTRAMVTKVMVTKVMATKVMVTKAMYTKVMVAKVMATKGYYIGGAFSWT